LSPTLLLFLTKFLVEAVEALTVVVAVAMLLDAIALAGNTRARA